MYGISNKKSFDLNVNCKPDIKLIECRHTVSGFLVHIECDYFIYYANLIFMNILDNTEI